VGEAVDVAGAKDKATSQLKLDSALFLLAMAGCPSACSRCGVVAAKADAAGSRISVPRLDKPAAARRSTGKCDPGFLAEKPRVLAVP